MGSSAGLVLAGQLQAESDPGGWLFENSTRGAIVKVPARISTLLFALIACASCAGPATTPSSSRWMKFVQVEGQAEPVPAEWVSTPEGRLAHSIKLPNPLPRDSGYREGMDAKEYFAHLCKTEAGEFIYKTVESVEGFLFARPPMRPTGDDLRDRYKLEAPEIERTFYLLSATPEDRAGIFIAPKFNLFRYVEEPNTKDDSKEAYLRSSGFVGGKSPMKVEKVAALGSRYGLTWRGLLRPRDRELGISGGEWLVYDLKSNEILAVMRNFGRTEKTPNSPEGLWWLNALSCPVFSEKYKFSSSEKIYDFVSKVLKPPKDPD